jgi:sulfur carrier protein
MIRIVLNGEPRELAPETTVAALVRDLGLPADGIAVAVDRDVVPRSAHERTALRDGARVEVIRAVGGG